MFLLPDGAGTAACRSLAFEVPGRSISTGRANSSTWAIGTWAIGTRAIGTRAVGTRAIDTRAVGTWAVGTRAIGGSRASIRNPG
jgi:hypothetical protein